MQQSIIKYFFTFCILYFCKTNLFGQKYDINKPYDSLHIISIFIGNYDLAAPHINDYNFKLDHDSLIAFYTNKFPKSRCSKMEMEALGSAINTDSIYNFIKENVKTIDQTKKNLVMIILFGHGANSSNPSIFNLRTHEFIDTIKKYVLNKSECILDIHSCEQKLRDKDLTALYNLKKFGGSIEAFTSNNNLQFDDFLNLSLINTKGYHSKYKVDTLVFKKLFPGVIKLDSVTKFSILPDDTSSYTYKLNIQPSMNLIDFNVSQLKNYTEKSDSNFLLIFKQSESIRNPLHIFSYVDGYYLPQNVKGVLNDQSYFYQFLIPFSLNDSVSFKKFNLEYTNYLYSYSNEESDKKKQNFKYYLIASEQIKNLINDIYRKEWKFK